LSPLTCPGQHFRRLAEDEPEAAAEAIGSLPSRDKVPTVGSFLCREQDDGNMQTAPDEEVPSLLAAMRGLSRARETDPRRRTAGEK